MRVRLFGFLLIALVSFPLTVEGHGYVPVQNPAVLLEHLVNHSDKLVTNINLTRSNGFRVIPEIVTVIVKTPCWGASFYNDVLAVAAQRGGPDPVGFEIGQLAKNFSIRVIQLNDVALATGPSPMTARAWDQANLAYFNAISAANFYLDTLIRARNQARWPYPVNNPALLQRRIDLLTANIIAIQDVMYMLRYAKAFSFPMQKNCIECSFMPHRITVVRGAPQYFFPYYANKRVVFPEAAAVRPMEAPEQFQPNYQVQQWSQRWEQVDQGYLGGAPGVGGPGVGRPGVGGPGVGGPGVGGPGVGGPGVGGPGVGGPGVGSPGVGSPGVGSPGVGSPGVGSPGVGSPGVGYPPQRSGGTSGGFPVQGGQPIQGGTGYPAQGGTGYPPPRTGGTSGGFPAQGGQPIQGGTGYPAPRTGGTTGGYPLPSTGVTGGTPGAATPQLPAPSGTGTYEPSSFDY